MKLILKRLIFLQFVILLRSALGQGWVAEIDIDFNHNLYAYEKIDNATLTFSGVTVSGSSQTSRLNLVIKGIDALSGNIDLLIDGLAWDPYDHSHPANEPIAASLQRTYNTPCVTGFFEGEGETASEQVYIWITIYPRMEISDFLQDCGQITLTSRTCSSSFLWEVSNAIDGGFIALEGKTSPTISLTRDELIAIGFTNPHGRKYFRVTGRYNTTSQLQAIDIYYPGPIASIDASPPGCHQGNDGKVKINITSPLPGVIDDFVATLFKINGEGLPLRQEYILNGATIEFAALQAGPYKIRIENNSSIGTYGNCWSDNIFTLQDPDPVVISSAEIPDFNGFELRCDGAKDGSITITPSGGTGTYTSYDWTPSVSNSSSASQLEEGVYTVKVQDSNGCWSELQQYTLIAPDKLSVAIISTGGKNGFDVSCHDKADGSVLTEVTGGVLNYAYRWSDNADTGTKTGLKAATYTVTVTDANGCAAAQSITLTAPEPIAFSIEELNAITCPGDYSGVLEIQSVVNPIGAVKYLWSTGEYGKQVFDKPAGSYAAVVSDEQGCSATRSYVLAEPTPYSLDVFPDSNYNGSTIRCNGEDNGSLTAVVRDLNGRETLADNYTWYKDGVPLLSGTTMSGISDLSSGTYKVEINYHEFCTISETFILSDPDPVTVTISATSDYNGMPISCAGATDASIHAQASGGTGSTFTFQWNSGETGDALLNLGAGTFAVTATDLNGCTGKTELTLTEPDTLKAAIAVLSNYNDQAISCVNAADARLKALAAGGTGQIQFLWNTGQTSPDLTDVAADRYTLVATDANGCTASADTTISNPDPVIARITEISNYSGFGVSCHGGADGYLFSAATGGTGEYTFTWTKSAQAGPSYTQLKAGTYTVTIRDQNSCADTAQATITEPGMLRLDAVAITNVSCNLGNDGQILLKALGGAGTYEFSISENTWQTGSLFTVLRAGSYHCLAKDANGCKVSIIQQISEPPAISINFEEIDAALCGEAKGKASAIVNGGVEPYHYEWKNSVNEIIANLSTVTTLKSGIYTMTIWDYNRCTATRSVAIPSADGPLVQKTDISPTTCSYSEDGAALMHVLGNEPLSFRWPDGQAGSGATKLRKGVYVVEIIDSNQCLTLEEIAIPGPDSLKIEAIEKTLPLCHGDCNGKLVVAAAGGNGGYRYQWGDIMGPILENLCSGTYAIEVMDEKQCFATTAITLGTPEPIVVNTATTRPPSCRGDCDGAVKLDASGGTGALTYFWSTAESTAEISNLCAGDYTVTIRDANFCRLTSTHHLEEPHATPLDLGGSIVLCEGQTHTLDAGPGWTNYFWSGSTALKSSDRRIIVSDAGFYALATVDSRGCVSRDTFTLKTSADLLQTNFLMASEAFTKDTVVFIDVSWPLPEAIQWTFPPTMKRLNDFGNIIYGRFENSGVYDVTLEANLGECRDDLTKTINIIRSADPVDGGGRLGNEPFVKEFTLYPNPNDGVFDVVVNLIHESRIALTLWNVLTSKKIGQWLGTGAKYYARNIDIRPLSAGSYSLRLDYDKGTRYLRFIVK